MESPSTLIEAVRVFSDLNVCHRFMIGVKWPDGDITCPRCGGDQVGNIALILFLTAAVAVVVLVK